MKFEIGPSGTPYDFENPEAYIPPEDFRQSIDLKNSEQEHKYSKLNQGLRILLVGAVAFTGIEIINNYNPYLEKGCVSTSDNLFDEPTSSTDLINKYEDYRDRELKYDINYDVLADTNNNDELSNFLNNQFKEQKISFHINKLPAIISEDSTSPFELVSESRDLGFFNTQLSSYALIETLENLPPGIIEELNGVDFYLTPRDMFLDSLHILGTYLRDGEERSIIIYINSNKIESSIYHEIGHLLQDKLCNGDLEDPEYSRLNDSNEYKINEKNNSEYFISDYASRSTAEDWAEVSANLFKFGAVACYDMPKPICEKELLILKRLSTVDPNISSYLVGKGASTNRDNMNGFKNYIG
jgi:hypothetical protein